LFPFISAPADTVIDCHYGCALNIYCKGLRQSCTIACVPWIRCTRPWSAAWWSWYSPSESPCLPSAASCCRWNPSRRLRGHLAGHVTPVCQSDDRGHVRWRRRRRFLPVQSSTLLAPAAAFTHKRQFIAFTCSLIRAISSVIEIHGLELMKLGW